jgi:hypothetical protein
LKEPLSEFWTRARIQADIRRIVGEQVGTYVDRLKDRFVDDIAITCVSTTVAVVNTRRFTGTPSPGER